MCLGLYLIFEHDQNGSSATATSRRGDAGASRISGRYDHPHINHNDHCPLARDLQG
jgi:hypothetical protein